MILFLSCAESPVDEDEFHFTKWEKSLVPNYSNGEKVIYKTFNGKADTIQIRTIKEEQINEGVYFMQRAPVNSIWIDLENEHLFFSLNKDFDNKTSILHVDFKGFASEDVRTDTIKLHSVKLGKSDVKCVILNCYSSDGSLTVYWEYLRGICGYHLESGDVFIRQDLW